MTTMHAHPRQTDRPTDELAKIMATVRRFILTNASHATNQTRLIGHTLKHVKMSFQLKPDNLCVCIKSYAHMMLTLTFLINHDLDIRAEQFTKDPI